MITLTLIRHGQAGPREDYDRLSDLGRRQAALLADWLGQRAPRFDAIVTGSLRRQRQTAQTIAGALPEAPEIVEDPRWNEFDLEGLWRTGAPILAGLEPAFARAAEEHWANPAVDRVITQPDIALIRSWAQGTIRHPDIEPWDAFQRRVAAPLQELRERSKAASIAVVTSATPTGIWAGMALELDAMRIFRVAAVLYNTSFTTLRVRPDDVTLLRLNQTPHLGGDLLSLR